MKTGHEKRTEERQNCFVPVEGKEGSTYDATQTVDISPHGIGFVSAHPHQINERIAIEIQLKPHTEPVLVLGTVKWVRRITDSEQFRVGLTFEEVLSGSSTRLEKYFSK